MALGSWFQVMSSGIPIGGSQTPSSQLQGSMSEFKVPNSEYELWPIVCASWCWLPHKEVNTLGLQPSSLLNVHPRRPKPSEMLEPHSYVGIIWGQASSDVDEN